MYVKIVKMDLEDRIQPAIRMIDGKPLTDDEFQKLLYDYFEERGILLDLRAHLRTQMINVLRDTPLGKSLINKPKEMSPKIQALNLLIAEYLFQKEYHYSLSVFSTEVPLNNTFPTSMNEFSSRDIQNFRFNENDMWDILETLGFLQSSETGKRVSSSYRDSNSESLLNCLLRNAKYQESCVSIPNRFMIEDVKKDVDVESFVAILKDSGLGATAILRIMENLKSLLCNEIKKLEETKNEEYAILKKKYDAESNRKVEKFQKKLILLEQVFENEKKRLERELEDAKTNLKECARSLQVKYNDINKLDEDIGKREKIVVMREQQILEKENVLMATLEEIVKQKKSYQELVLKTNKVCLHKEQQTVDNINLENAVLKKNAQSMQLQIESLQEQNGNYLQRIQELAIKTNSLMRELEESQRCQDLHGIHRSTSIFASSSRMPPLPAISFNPPYGLTSYHIGAGEQGGRSKSKTTSLLPVYTKDWRQRKQCSNTMNMINNNNSIEVIQSCSSSDEMSQTEQILHETKTRLQNLEKESEEIDRHYEDYKTRATNVGLLNDFHANVASIRDSISRIFTNHHPTPSRSSQSVQFLPETSHSIYIDNDDNDQKMAKIKNLIAELPLTADEEQVDDVIQSLRTLHEPTNPSINSSAIVIGTSLSTLEISSDNHNSDVEAINNGDISAYQSVIGIWDSVGISCLIALVVELIIFRS